MTRPPDDADALLRRFSVAERWIHRTTATLVGIAIVTAVFLYVPALSELVSRRHLLVTVHEWSGTAIPVPVLAGLVSRAFRADLTRLNRFPRSDRGWVRAALRGRELPSGKFNAGQKMYAAVATGSILVMLGTGLIMWFPRHTSLFARVGATFVHEWLALLLGILILGHLWMAYNDPEARRGLRTGYVARAWAVRHHVRWAEQVGASTPDEETTDPRGDRVSRGPG